MIARLLCGVVCGLVLMTIRGGGGLPWVWPPVWLINCIGVGKFVGYGGVR